MTGSSKSPPKEVMVNPSIIRKIPVTNEQSNQFTKNNFTNDNDNNKYDKNNNETIIKNDNIMATTMNDRQQFSSASSIKQQQQHNFGLDHTTIRHKTNNIPSFFMIRYISSMIPIICKSCIFVSISLYLLNQKHLLPKPLSRIVSNVMFWPTIPITMINRNILNEHKWITTIDDTVIMGGAPFGFMNFPKLLYQTYGVRYLIFFHSTFLSFLFFKRFFLFYISNLNISVLSDDTSRIVFVLIVSISNIWVKTKCKYRFVEL